MVPQPLHHISSQFGTPLYTKRCGESRLPGDEASQRQLEHTKYEKQGEKFRGL
jgi:hypothetical protein